MDIHAVIDYLNRENELDLDSTYYSDIGTWRDWWQGFHKPFHQFKEAGAEGKLIDRKLYSLRMGKKIPEDWASVLLNEETDITLKDQASNEFIQQVLQDNAFWLKGNQLIEKAFALGTGAFVLRMENMRVKGDEGAVLQDSNTKIRIEYLAADHIIPLSVKYGKITEVAFVSDVLQAGVKMIYLETHKLVGKQYEIHNQYFRVEEGELKAQPLPEGMLEYVKTGDTVPLFSIVTPNIVNNIKTGCPLGVSVFGNAIDNLEGVDLAYNNFNRDFKLGGKKVFMNDRLTKMTDTGTRITPDDVAQQLFVEIGDNNIDQDGTRNYIQEHNPLLRVDENVSGVQAQLDLLSFKCGLGSKFYQFNEGKVVTATEYTGDRQDLVKNTHKHLILVRDAINELIRSILWVGSNLTAASVDPETDIDINFDDTYITDSASERATDLQDVREGLMQKYEYRMKWYDEDEATAKAKVPNAGEEADPFGFNEKGGGNGNR